MEEGTAFLFPLFMLSSNWMGSITVCTNIVNKKVGANSNANGYFYENKVVWKTGREIEPLWTQLFFVFPITDGNMLQWEYLVGKQTILYQGNREEIAIEQQFTTQNGICVYCYPQPHLHSVCLTLTVKAGILYESEQEHGITHFLEHIFFRNLAGIPQVQLYRELQKIGAQFNAYTYQNVLHFLISAAPRHFTRCVQLLTGLLAPLQATVQDVSLERGRIQSEIREEEQEHSAQVFCDRAAFAKTPLARAIAGTITGVQRIKLQDLQAKQREIFTTDNLFFYVTGNIPPDGPAILAEEIEKYPVSHRQCSRKNLAPVPEQFCARKGNIRWMAQEQKNSSLVEIALSFDLDMSRYTMAEIDLLYAILFFGELGRFKMKLSEETGFIYDFDPDCTLYPNLGILSVGYAVSPSRAVQSAKLCAEVFRSVKEKVGEEDISLILPEYEDNNAMMLDDPERLNWHMAYENHIMHAGYTDILQQAQAYRKVTPERIMQIAQEVLIPSHLVCTVKSSMDLNEKRQFRNNLLCM